LFVSGTTSKPQGPDESRDAEPDVLAVFIYVGDSNADLAVWIRASRVILVNPGKSVREPRLRWAADVGTVRQRLTADQLRTFDNKEAESWLSH
jgi:hypothetical protein